MQEKIFLKYFKKTIYVRVGLGYEMDVNKYSQKKTNMKTYNSKALLPNKQCSYDAKIYVVPPNVARKKETKQTIN